MKRIWSSLFVTALLAAVSCVTAPGHKYHSPKVGDMVYYDLTAQNLAALDRDYFLLDDIPSDRYGSKNPNYKLQSDIRPSLDTYRIKRVYLQGTIQDYGQFGEHRYYIPARDLKVVLVNTKTNEEIVSERLPAQFVRTDFVSYSEHFDFTLALRSVEDPKAPGVSAEVDLLATRNIGSTAYVPISLKNASAQDCALDGKLDRFVVFVNGESYDLVPDEKAADYPESLYSNSGTSFDLTSRKGLSFSVAVGTLTPNLSGQTDADAKVISAKYFINSKNLQLTLVPYFTKTGYGRIDFSPDFNRGFAELNDSAPDNVAKWSAVPN